MKGRAITLLYHDVIDGDNADLSGFSGPNSAEYTIHVDEFDKHLIAVKNAKKGEVINANNLLTYGNHKNPPIIFTFDDGGVSAYQHIAPMLEQHGWRGCFFITTEKIGDPAFVDEEQIINLHKRGHTIGSHSRSHPRNMALLSREQILEEWKHSIGKLSEILGESIKIASIPSGFYSRDIAEAADQSGIEVLFTSEPVQKFIKVGNCTVIGRFSVKRGMSASVPAGYASGNIKMRLSMYMYWNIKKYAKKLTGPIYPWLRNRYLAGKNV